MPDETADWRASIETDVRKLDSSIAKLFTKQDATDDKIEAQNDILVEIRRDLGALRQGPELWRYGTLFVATIASAWFLVETKVEAAMLAVEKGELEFYVQTVEPRLTSLESVAVDHEERIASNKSGLKFQWDELKQRDERRERRERERATALDLRITDRFAGNEAVLERLRAAREQGMQKASDAAVADKDAIEREQMIDLRRAVERLETAVGHLRAAFPHNLPGSDE